MVNQSIISVPPNLEDPVVLRRFLSRLVEQLDIVEGNRAGEGSRYVSTEELVAQADALQVSITKANDALDAATEDLKRLITLNSDGIDARLEAIEAKDLEQDTRLGNLDNYGAIKAIQLDFTIAGISTLVYNLNYNINESNSSKIGTGLYEFELDTASFGADNYLGNLTVAIQETIASSATSADYHVEFIDNSLPAGKFRLQVYAVEQDVGNALKYTAYDLLPGDTISLTALFNKPGTGPV